MDRVITTDSSFMRHIRFLILGLFFLLSIIVTSRSLFAPGFFQIHDTTHIARIAEMNRSLQAGEFPVRWSQNFGFGYGMPLFSFYAPLPYYLAQIPYSLGVSGIDTLKILYVFNGVLTFVGMYLLSSRLFGKTGGFISSVMFSFSSYRAVDLFVRGAIGEVYAMTLIPFALYGVTVLQTDKKKGILITAASLACILLSHNLLGMLSVGVVIAFTIIPFIMQWSKKNQGKQIGKLAFSIGVSLCLAVGLSSFYIFPAFFEKNNTRVEQTITTGYFDYHDHFIALRQFVTGKWGYGGSLPGLIDGFSFAYGYSVIAFFIVAVISALIFGNKRQRILIVTLTLFCVGMTLLCTNRTVWLWDIFPLSKFIQFPWRLLTFSHVFLGLCCGSMSIAMRKHVSIKILCALFLIVVVATQSKLFVPEAQLLETDTFYSSEPEFITTTVSKTLNDYMPPAVIGDNWPVPAKERITPTFPGATVTYQKSTPAQVLATLQCPEQCRFELNVYQFPEWKGYVNGNQVKLEKAVHMPIYEVVVPKGEHEFLLKLTDTPLRSVSNWVSFVSVIVLLFSTIELHRKKKHA